MWLWFKYKRAEFDFSKYLEVPMAKTFEKSYYSVDTMDDGRIYMLMKLQCVMKDAWKIKSFPFDRQKLRFSIENSQYDASSLVFVEDTVGEHYSNGPSQVGILLQTASESPVASKNMKRHLAIRRQLKLNRHSVY